MMVPIVQAVLDQLHGNVDPEPSSESQRTTVVPHQEKTISDPENMATDHHMTSEGETDDVQPQDKPPSGESPAEEEEHLYKGWRYLKKIVFCGRKFIFLE